jgi:hypothetical protein
MSTSRVLRRIALGGVVLALAAVAPSTAAAGRADTASTVATIATPAREGSPTSTVDRVADFYGAYIDALYDSGHGALTGSLRQHYLTAGLQHSLARWENAHHEDGVLRAKGVPTAWQVVYNDSGMGHCWTRLTLTWQDSGSRVHHTHLMIQSDLATRLVSGIQLDG